MSILKRKKGYFSISAVAKMFSVHQQTIRLYEKEGLLAPKRSAGNTRLFSEEDVDRLEEIIYLTHQLGINLAGVEMILKLKKQISKMQKEMNKVFENNQKELDAQIEHSKQTVSTTAKRLLKIKKTTVTNDGLPTPSLPHIEVSNSHEHQTQSKIFDADDWEIEYDE